jgi:hypothetical protein
MSETTNSQSISPVESLKTLFGITGWVVIETTGDFVDQDGLFQPKPHGNCASWILGHILHSRMAVLRGFGQKPEWDETDGAQYARGALGIDDAEKAIPFTELLAIFNRTQEAIIAALDSIGDTNLAKMGKDKTRFDELLFMHFHESYHVGQLSIIRRLLGKDSVIK